jgi:hypothetical protein
MDFCCFFKVKGVVETLLQPLLLSKLDSRFLQFSEKNGKKKINPEWGVDYFLKVSNL